MRMRLRCLRDGAGTACGYQRCCEPQCLSLPLPEPLVLPEPDEEALVPVPEVPKALLPVAVPLLPPELPAPVRLSLPCCAAPPAPLPEP